MEELRTNYRRNKPRRLFLFHLCNVHQMNIFPGRFHRKNHSLSLKSDLLCISIYVKIELVISELKVVHIFNTSQIVNAVKVFSADSHLNNRNKETGLREISQFQNLQLCCFWRCPFSNENVKKNRQKFPLENNMET